MRIAIKKIIETLNKSNIEYSVKEDNQNFVLTVPKNMLDAKLVFNKIHKNGHFEMLGSTITATMDEILESLLFCEE